MNSDVEENPEGSSHRSGFEVSTPSITDDDSDADLATVLTQLIRSGRAHILSERNLSLEEQSGFIGVPLPPDIDNKPDLSMLKESDIFLSTSLAAGVSKYDCKSFSSRIPSLIYQRQIGMNGVDRFSQRDRSFIGHNYLPNEFCQVANYNHKMFCGSYSKDGNIFLSASQERILRVFDTSQGKFKPFRKISARDVGWSILDTAFSPDGCSIIYSSWSESIHMCNVYGEVERHEVLPLCPDVRRFCIFSLTFSQDGREVLGGANDGCLYIYDCESRQRTLKILAHEEDVNTVAYADETSQIFFSGSDDGICKVWDRRTLVESAARPVGILAGHVDGLTYVDSRGDGRHLITNSKDQSIKLWDMRKFSGSDAQESTYQVVRNHNWDYRWQNVPWRLACSKNKIPGDTSLMTYRGHSVLQTLIRCHFSPAFSTGQRYIYTGCAAGRVVIYDVLTGQVETALLGHTACVRDVSWHPYSMEIIDTAWDGRHFKWFYVSTDSDSEVFFDSDNFLTDSDSNDSVETAPAAGQWSLRPRHQSHSGTNVRRSPRLAARRESQSQEGGRKRPTRNPP